MAYTITDENLWFQHLTHDELLAEKWSEMPDWPRYIISDLGRAMNVQVLKSGKPKNKVLRPQFNPSTGYLQYRLYNEDGEWEALYAHRCVIQAHEGSIPTEQCVDHINEDKTDNRFVNIRVTSRAHNLWRSERHENYTAATIAMAHDLRKEGWSYPKIADFLGVSGATAWRWINGVQRYLGGEGRA